MNPETPQTQADVHEEYYCSITAQIMMDPVSTADGLTYEREAIEAWLVNHDTSPETNERLPHKNLTPNVTLRRLIRKFLDSNSSHYSEEVYFPEQIKRETVLAIQEVSLSQLRSLYSKHPRLLTAQLDNQGFNAFHKIAELRVLDENTQAMLEFVIEKLKLDDTRDGGQRHLRHSPENWQPNLLNILYLEAVVANDFAALQRYIRLGAQLTAQSSQGQNALHIASAGGSVQIVEWLFKELPSEYVDIKDQMDKSALMLAVENGHVMVANSLLRNHANSHDVDRQGRTALHIAVVAQEVACVEFLLSHRGDVNRADTDGNTALHLAVMQGNLSLVKLVHNQGGDPELRNNQGLAAYEVVARYQQTNINTWLLTQRLYWALGAKDIERLKFLTQEGADLSQLNERGQSLLHLAVKENSLEALEYLLCNMSADVENNEGQTPLQLAIKENNVPAVKLLLKKGQGEIKDELHLAIEHSQLEVAELLIGYFPNCINNINKEGYTALMLSARAGHAQLVSVLLERGARTGEMDKEGNTALHWATLSRHHECCQMLLAYDSPVNQANHEGDTPLHIAARLGDLNEAKCLVAKGAEISRVNFNQQSAVETAELHHRLELKTWLLEQGVLAAIREKSADNIKRYLTLGAKVDTRNAEGKSLIEIAAMQPDDLMLKQIIQVTGGSQYQELCVRPALQLAIEMGYQKNIQLILGAYPAIGEAVIHIFMLRGDIGHVQMLLATMPSLMHARDNEGNSVLMVAASKGYHELVEQLLSQDVKGDHVNNQGNSALHLAILGRHEQCANLLLNQSSNLSQLNDAGESPLHLAAINNNLELIQRMKMNGADLDCRNRRGLTAYDIAEKSNWLEGKLWLLSVGLDKAVKENSVKKIKYYVGRGAQLTRLNEDGQTLLHQAIQDGNYESLSHLSSVMNPNTSNATGESPLYCAILQKNKTAIKILMKNKQICKKDVLRWVVEHQLDELIDLVLRFLPADTLNAQDGEGNTALMLASARGNKAIATVLFNNNAKTELANREGNTALHLAVIKGHTEVVKILLARCKHVNAANSLGQTSLHLAAQGGQIALVRLLLVKGADIHAVDRTNRLAAEYVVQSQFPDTKEWLLLHGVFKAIRENDIEKLKFYLTQLTSPEILKLDGESLLEVAVAAGHEAVLTHLLEVMDRTVINRDYWSLLHAALAKGEPRIAQVLVQAADNLAGLLHDAIEAGERELAELMLTHAPQIIHTRNKKGLSPLMQAVLKDDVALLTLLFKHKAEVDDVDSDGNNGLQLAIINNNQLCLPLLIDKVKNINHKNANGETVLHLAARYRDFLVTQTLLSNNADSTLLDNKDQTALHQAVAASNIKVVSCLVREVNVNIPNEKGDTPLHEAVRLGTKDIVELLIQNGADPRKPNREGQTSLLIAQNTNLHLGGMIEQYHKEVLGKLLEAAQDGDLEILKKLHNQGVDVKQKGGKDINALHIACRGAGKASVIEWLLEQGLDINSKTTYGSTALEFAAQGKNIQAIKLLFERGAVIHDSEEESFFGTVINMFPRKMTPDNNDELSRQQMQQKQLGELVEWLLKRMSSINKKTAKFLWWVSIRNGWLEVCKALLLIWKGMKLKHWENGLKYAIYADQTGMVAWILNNTDVVININKAIYIEKVDGGDLIVEKGTYLMLALERGQLETARQLVSKGADLQVKNEDGQNLLQIILSAEGQYVSDNKRGRLIQWLLEHEVPFDCIAKRLWSDASEYGWLEVLKILKSKGMDINTECMMSSYYGNALDGIFFDEFSTPFDFLLRAREIGATSNTLASHMQGLGAMFLRNKKGSRGLEEGESFKRRGEVTAWLLEAGVNMERDGGKRLWFKAIEHRWLNVLKALVARGFDFTICNNEGEDCLFIAVELYSKQESKLLEKIICYFLLDLGIKSTSLNSSMRGKAENIAIKYRKEQAQTGIDLLGFYRVLLNDKNAENHYMHDIPIKIWVKIGFDIVQGILSRPQIEKIADYAKMPPKPLADKAVFLQMFQQPYIRCNDVNLEANTWNKKGSGFFEAGAYSEALFCYQKAVSLYTTSSNIPSVQLNIALLYSNIAACLREQGKIQDAVQYYQKSYAIRCKLLGNEEPTTKKTKEKLETCLRILRSNSTKMRQATTVEEKQWLDAAGRGNFHLMVRLYEMGININVCDEDGDNALKIAACYSANVQIVDWLLRVGKEKNIESFFLEYRWKEGVTLFLGAALLGRLSTLMFLIEKRADIRALNNKGENALHLAARHSYQASGKTEVVEYLLHIGFTQKIAEFQVESKTKDGWTPLLCAAQTGQLQVIKLLVERGACVTYKEPSNENNILHIAALCSNNKELVEWLLDYGIKNRVTDLGIESKGYNQKTPFLSAAEGGHLDVMKSLVTRRANLSACDKYGNSALQLVVQNDASIKSITWLISVGKAKGIKELDINYRSHMGATILHHAAKEGKRRIIEVLLSLGADLNARDGAGNTVDHLAKVFGHSELADWLGGQKRKNKFKC